MNSPRFNNDKLTSPRSKSSKSERHSGKDEELKEYRIPEELENLRCILDNMNQNAQKSANRVEMERASMYADPESPRRLKSFYQDFENGIQTQ